MPELLAVVADAHPVAVVGEHLELVDVVGRPRPRAVELRHDRVDAAGVVADHPAERAVVVRRRIGPEGEIVLLRSCPRRSIEHDTRLDARSLRHGVDLEDPVQVLREVDDHRDVAALAGEAGAAAAREHRRTVLAGRRRSSRRRRRRFAGRRPRSVAGGSSSRRRRRARGRRRRSAPRRRPCGAGRTRAPRTSTLRPQQRRAGRSPAERCVSPAGKHRVDHLPERLAHDLRALGDPRPAA